MTTGCRTTDSDTSSLPPIKCAPWCAVDHDSGDYLCQTDRRHVIRVPEVPSGVSSVHGFRATEDSRPRLTIEGKFWAVDSAREYARTILAVADQMEPAHPNALKALAALATSTDTTLEAIAQDLAIELDGATADDVSRVATAIGARL